MSNVQCAKRLRKNSQLPYLEPTVVEVMRVDIKLLQHGCQPVLHDLLGGGVDHARELSAQGPLLRSRGAEQFSAAPPCRGAARGCTGLTCGFVAS